MLQYNNNISLVQSDLPTVLAANDSMNQSEDKLGHSLILLDCKAACAIKVHLNTLLYYQKK